MIGLLSYCVLTAACSGSPARLGSRFADAYAAFAPLYALHRSYGDHLFHGTTVEIPSGLESACADFSYELALFYVDYIVQTESATAGGLAYLTRLRAESAAFCDANSAWIEAIASSDGTDVGILRTAGDAGFFAEIKRTNDLLEAALDEILAGIGEGIERWSFGAAFSIRTLVSQPAIDRISTELREILYADPQGTAPPLDVPVEVARAMEWLVGLSGRELSASESEEALNEATAIYEYLMAEL